MWRLIRGCIKQNILEMTAFFKKKVIPFLWEWEGTKYEDDPDDPGNNPPEGANKSYRGTKFGIDARSHPNVDIKNLTADQAMQIYWNDWIRLGVDHIPYPLNWCFFDSDQNNGLSRANLWLKLCGGDYNKYLDLRVEKYKSIASHNQGLAKELNGWLNRVDALRKEIQS